MLTVSKTGLKIIKFINEQHTSTHETDVEMYKQFE